MPKPLNVMDKIGDFIEKYTGSSYNYTEPSADIPGHFKQIGETFGIPVYFDPGTQYQREFLDFPTLSDILQTVVPKISFNIKFGKCSVCLTINYNIPLIKYPPITICLEKPECKKQENKSWYQKECLTEKDLEEISKLSAEELVKIDPRKLPPRCPPESPEDFDFPPLKPGQYYQKKVFITSLKGVKSETDWMRYDPEDFRYYPNFNYPRVVYFDEVVGGCIEKHWGYGYYLVTSNKFFYSSDDFYHYYDYELCNYRTKPDIVGPSTQRDRLHGTTIYRLMPDNKIIAPEKFRPVKIPDPVVPMDCCEELKKILARIEKRVIDIDKVLNVQQFKDKGVQIPSNWIYPGNDSESVILEDIPDLIAAVARLIDRRTGFMPQLVRIKDSDPTKEGDQQLDLVVNSLADAVRLILEYLLQTHGDVGGIQMMQAANLYETGINHQIAVTMWSELQAISEFLDYDTKQSVERFKMAFNPKLKVDPKNPEGLDKILPKFLKHTTQEVEVNEFKGGKTLKDIVNDIKRDTANIAAGVTRKLSEHSLDDLVEETQQIQRLKRLLLVKELSEREGILDLKEFFKDAEEGFPSSDVAPEKKGKPYGFQPTNKPKMKVTTQKSKKLKYKKP